MSPRITRGQFVNVVASVDLNAGTGKIAYVNPTGAGMRNTLANQESVELQVADATGQVLFSRKPQVLFNSEGSPDSRTALINEAIPFIQGMREVRLLVNGEIASRYVAEQTDVPADARMALSELPPPSANRRALAGPAAARRSGMTYTIQARAAGDTVWQTLAVGRSVPDIEVDIDQFPTAEKIDVRVLITNGFQDRVAGEHELVIGKRN